MNNYSRINVRSKSLATSVLVLSLAGALSTQARAADLAAPVVAPAPLLSGYFSTVTHTLQVEAGIAGNPASPPNKNNFGQEFTDIPNQVELNQVLLTLARPVDQTKAYDLGFNLQGLYGSDGRYDPTLGLLSYTLKGRNQAIFTNINVVAHTPFITGSLDTKIGLFPGIMGYETTDPSTRPFYTLSYVTNFLLAFQHVGAVSTWHVNPTVDIWAGIDTGNETTFGKFDNNSEPAGYLGFGLNNLLDNKLTVLAISRLGPEDSLLALPVGVANPDANQALRFWNDVTLTYLATPKLTLVGEANYFKDQGIRNQFGEATAYGFDGYISYAYNEQVTFNYRGEIYRDNTGLLTAGYLSNTAFTNSIAGYNDSFAFAPPTTYGAVTVGLNYKPTVLNTKDYHVAFRPEVRYDTSLNGTKPFDVQRQSDRVLISGDIIVGF